MDTSGSPVGRQRRDFEKQLATRYLMRILESLRDAPLAAVRAAFAKSGLDYDQVRREPAIAEAYDLYALLHCLNRDDCCPGIGLRFSLARDLLDLGVVGYAMLSCRDLRMARELIAKFNRLTTNAFDEVLVEDGRWAVVRELIRPDYAPMRVVVDEEQVTGTWRGLCSLLQPEPSPADVHIEVAHDEPDYSELYLELMGCKPEFSKPETFFAFPMSWLDRPVQTADPIVKQVCESQCSLLLQELKPADELIDRVRRLILEMPTNRERQLDEVANRMRMSTRTLGRRLNASGTSFRKIANEVRMRLADHYLSIGHLSLKEIAFLLGYSELGTFYRAFRDWHGMTPKEYRRTRLHIDDPVVLE